MSEDFNLEEYEVIPSISVTASRMLVDTYEKLGKPQDPFSDSGEKVMEVLVAMWQDLYPKEAREFLANRKEYKDSELSIGEQSRKGTGRSLASVPTTIHLLMTKLFPKYKSWNRDDWIRFVKKYPMFQMANKV